MLENEKVMVPYIGEEIHVSRLIASWLNVGGDTFAATFNNEGVAQYAFLVWLEELGIGEEDIRHIWELVTCGKFELEHSAKKFRETHEVLDE